MRLEVLACAAGARAVPAESAALKPETELNAPAASEVAALSETTTADTPANEHASAVAARSVAVNAETQASATGRTLA